MAIQWLHRLILDVVLILELLQFKTSDCDHTLAILYPQLRINICYVILLGTVVQFKAYTYTNNASVSLL